jgi:MoxR-like ATPase
VLAAVDGADAARVERNKVVHQDWVLRHADAMRSVGDLASVTEGDLASYLDEWRREAKESAHWQSVPHDSIEVVRAQTLDDLRAVEQALAAATDRVTELTFSVASAREAGTPPGWVSDVSRWGSYATPKRHRSDSPDPEAPMLCSETCRWRSTHAAQLCPSRACLVKGAFLSGRNCAAALKG